MATRRSSTDRVRARPARSALKPKSPRRSRSDRNARRPYVLINMSMTADGKIASATRAITHFGSARDARHLYALRATADAILCGARTVEESDTILGNGGEEFRRRRLRAGLAEHPLRIVVTGAGTLSPQARIWAHRYSPIIALTSSQASARRIARLRTLADDVWVGRARAIDWKETLDRLHAEFGVRRLLCEGGGGLNDALIQAGLVDEIHLTLCPLLLGGRQAPTIADGIGAARLAGTPWFHLQSIRKRGEELFLVYQRAKPT